MSFKTIVVSAALFALVIFVAQNYQVVEIKFLVWSFNISRALVLFLVFMGGLFVGLSLGLFDRKRD